MICDGRNKGKISPVDEVIHIICSPHKILHVFHDSFHLVHLSLQMWYPTSNGTPRLSLLALFSEPSFPEFWPHSPPWFWHCLLTSLVNSWFRCVSSAITAAMDCNCCLTVIFGGGGGGGGWWCTIWMTGGVPTLLLSWTSGHWPSPNHPAFLSSKAEKLVLRNFLTLFFPTDGADWWCTKINRLKYFRLW